LAVSFQASTLFAVRVLLVEGLRGILCRFTLLFAAEVIERWRAAGRMLAAMLLAPLLLSTSLLAALLLAALLPATLLLAALLLAALLPRLLALLVPGAGRIAVLIVSLILRHLDLLNEVVEARSYASPRAQQAASRYPPATMRTTQPVFALSFRP
jgi:hypothetical protein